MVSRRFFFRNCIILIDSGMFMDQLNQPLEKIIAAGVIWVVVSPLPYPQRYLTCWEQPCQMLCTCSNHGIYLNVRPFSHVFLEIHTSDNNAARLVEGSAWGSCSMGSGSRRCLPFLGKFRQISRLGFVGDQKYFASSDPHHGIQFILSDILSGISIWRSIWHVFWHSIWHIFWHSIWHIFWHSIWHSIWHIF